MKMFVMYSFSRKESAFPMATYLDKGNNYIYNVKAPVNGNQGVNKSYIDQHVAKSGDMMSGSLNMGGNNFTSVGDATNGSDTINMNFYNTVPLKSKLQSRLVSCTTRTASRATRIT